MTRTNEVDYRTKQLGEILIERGLIAPRDLQRVLSLQEKTGKRLGQILIEEGILSEEALAEALSLKLNIPKVDIDSYAIDPQVVHLIPKEMAKKYKLIPLFRVENTLTVAMADPLDVFAIDAVRHYTGLQIQEVIATPSDVEQAIERYYGMQDSLEAVIENLKKEGGDATGHIEERTVDVQADIPEEASIIKLVNLLLTQALRDRASDIHIEPEEKNTNVRYRIDGLLHLALSLPRNFHQMIVSRIKVMGNMDVSEKRLPQDGRFQFRLDRRIVDVRVSILPTVKGEKVVMRLLDKSGFLLRMDQMGFSEENLRKWMELIHKPQGMILITGPTGSGKTSTLYTALSEINTPEKNIVTVENPVEYRFPMINQVQIHPKAGLTFAEGLRAILRQDPDVIMIGEIRDLESAEIAIRSALTGHLVFSTLHTNDAASAITRLVDMGVEPFLVSSSLIAVLAQRLVRRICPHCKEAYPLSDREKVFVGDQWVHRTFYRGKGCRECHRMGYRGRLAIHELLVIDEEIRRLIVERASDTQIQQTAVAKGMSTLRADGLEKASQGLTSVEEVLRVTA